MPAIDPRRGDDVVTNADNKCPERNATCRVLIVDDHHDAADSLAMLLKLWGHEVQVAYDGPSALTIAQEYKPEVVLLDLALPKMSGYEVARRLREEVGLVDALFVALTGYGQEKDRRRTEEAGFCEHLVKPVDPRELETLLEGFCRTVRAG
jgi:CheY-like chemotaxis protein